MISPTKQFITNTNKNLKFEWQIKKKNKIKSFKLKIKEKISQNLKQIAQNLNYYSHGFSNRGSFKNAVSLNVSKNAFKSIKSCALRCMPPWLVLMDSGSM